LELPTYTNIWRIEKRLYKLYDFRLPMPVPVGQIAVFAAIAVPYVVVLKVIGLPFSHTLLWLYILPPAALAWLITRPVLEGKRLPELVVSQLRYLSEPRTWCRMAPLAEKEEIAVIARVWRQVDAAAAAVPEASAAAVAEVASIEAADVETAGIETVGGQTADAGTAQAEAEAGARLFDVEIDDFDDVEIDDFDDLETADAETADAGPVVTSQPVVAAAAKAPPPPAEHQPERSALTRHLPTGPVPAWPKAAGRIGRASLPLASAPTARDVPGQPVCEVPAPPPARETPGQPARGVPAPPPVRETLGQPGRAIPPPVPPVRKAPDQPARAVPPPVPPVRDVPARAARPAPPPGLPPPPRSRPVVTVTGNQHGERTARMVERALGKPAERRAAGWREHVVFVPGGHRPGQADPMQRDRARARLPVRGRHRIVVLGCTVGAGQTTTALLTGEVLASLRDDQVAALDLNPGPGSLAERARAVPALTTSRPPAPSRLEVVTRETAAHGGAPGAAHPGEEPADVTKIFELLSARYPLTLADPAAAVVSRVLAAASQLILVSPASQDAASALATTREWLEAHGHAGLAEGAIIVLNGVSRHTMPYVEQAEALARGRSRAIVRVPWDDHLKNQDPQRAYPPAPGAHPSRAAGPLTLAALQAYTALAGVLVAALASAPGQLRARP
jgi:TcpE family